MSVKEIGEDFCSALDQLEQPRTEAEAQYIELPLDQPAAIDACHSAQQRGYFYGCLIPYRRGCDRLRLQKLCKKHFAEDNPHIASSEGRALWRFILDDRRSAAELSAGERRSS